MESWERGKGESPRAYAAFVVYRDMGAQRSHAKAAQNLGKSRSVISEWASRWSWSERCGEWDRHIQQEADAAHTAAIKDVATRHAQLARDMQSKVAARLLAMTDNALELGAGDIARWLDIAVKVERLSMGMSTQTVEHAGKDGGAIKLDMVRQARESLAEKLAPIDAEQTQAVVAPEGHEDAL